MEGGGKISAGSVPLKVLKERSRCGAGGKCTVRCQTEGYLKGYC